MAVLQLNCDWVAKSKRKCHLWKRDWTQISKKGECQSAPCPDWGEGDKMGKYWCHLSKASAKHKIALFPTIRHLRKSGHHLADFYRLCKHKNRYYKHICCQKNVIDVALHQFPDFSHVWTLQLSVCTASFDPFSLSRKLQKVKFALLPLLSP